MEVFSTLLSFIPVLMIVLFIVRFIAGAGKRRRPARLDGLADQRRQPPASNPKPPETEQEEMPAIQPEIPKHRIEKAAPPPEPITVNHRSPQKSRLSSLSELKRAVVWAEILGKPKGLQ